MEPREVNDNAQPHPQSSARRGQKEGEIRAILERNSLFLSPPAGGGYLDP